MRKCESTSAATVRLTANYTIAAHDKAKTEEIRDSHRHTLSPTHNLPRITAKNEEIRIVPTLPAIWSRRHLPRSFNNSSRGEKFRPLPDSISITASKSSEQKRSTMGFAPQTPDIYSPPLPCIPNPHHNHNHNNCSKSTFSCATRQVMPNKDQGQILVQEA